MEGVSAEFHIELTFTWERRAILTPMHGDVMLHDCRLKQLLQKVQIKQTFKFCTLKYSACLLKDINLALLFIHTRLC